jgi:ABC-type uncharacterized transport system substrate-binding protein
MWSRAVGCLVTLTLSLLTAPLLATAQPLGTLPLVGVLDPGRPHPPGRCLAAFQQGLRDLGYAEGHTIRFAYRYGEDDADRLPPLAAELVQLAPDVIWLHSTPAAVAAKRATTTIPVVIAVASNLLEQGLVASLARPGGNLTGLDLRGADIVAKQLEVLKDALPTLSRVAALRDPTIPSEDTRHTLEQAARALGVQLQQVETGAPTAFEAAFAAMVDGGAEALLIPNTAFFAKHRQQLLALALRHRLPTVVYARNFAEAGSLLTLGVDVARELCPRSAAFVHKILRGAKPADLPIERVDKFPLVVNLQTAEALGLTLSPLFLFRADEVIK